MPYQDLNLPQRIRLAYKNHLLILKKPELKETYGESWYFSAEGKKAYENLLSNADKTRFFMNYLRTIERKDLNELHMSYSYTLYRIAYVMAHSMVDSKLEFGGYPNVLDETKNPLVKYVKHCSSEHKKCDKPLFCFQLIRRFGENSISFCDDGQSPTDMYKIERDIIFMFDKEAHQSGTAILKVYQKVLDDVMFKDIDSFDEENLDAEDDIEIEDDIDIEDEE